MKPLNSLQKRDLLAARKYDPDVVREYAEDSLSNGLYSDALAFFQKLEDRRGLDRIKRLAVETGNLDLLWLLERDDRSMIEKSDWASCGDAAMRLGKFRNAAYAFWKAGDEPRQAKAEAEFKPKPPAPAPDEKPDV